jgi:hypothetical protein
MMGARLFLSQAFVERVAGDGAAELAEGALVVRGGTLDGARLDLVPAVRVVSLAGEGSDTAALAGKVKRLEDLRALGAEVLGDSMILGEAAYDLEPGFLAEPGPAWSGRLVPMPDGQPTKEAPPQGQSDAESLARFLLNRLP